MAEHLLHRIHLFSSLPDHEIHRLADALLFRQLQPQEFLFHEDEPGDSFFIILDGQVEVVKSLETGEEKVLALRQSGDFIGEIALLSPDSLRTASVRALNQVSLVQINQQRLYQLLESWPLIGLNMLREVARRLRQSDKATIQDLQEKNRLLQQAYQELQAAMQQIVQKEALERELTVARQIQMSILPQTLPHYPQFEFGVKIEAARYVGGDFFDFIPLGRQHCALIVADVSDKGVPAAIFMGLTRSLLRAKASRSAPPEVVLQRVNRLLLQMNQAGLFVTVFYGLLDLSTRVFSYARAGHELPLILDGAGQWIPLEKRPGQPLGLFAQPVLDFGAITVSQDSQILLFTDGLLDALNVEGEFYGLDRLKEALLHYKTLPAQIVCERIFAEIKHFQGEAPTSDDMTLLMIQCLAAGGKEAAPMEE